MRHLSISQEGQRLALVIPDSTALRAAAKAIRGHRYEGKSRDHIVFSFPAAPDVARDVVDAFEPMLSPSSKAEIDALLLKHVALEAATAAKEFDGSLGFDAQLRTAPMAHQIAAMNFAWARFGAGAKGMGLLMEQGTGKTLVAIGIANSLRSEGRVEWALVVAPNCLRGTWGGPEGEVVTHSAREDFRCIIPQGTREVRTATVEAAVDECGADWFPWVILNYEFFALNDRRNASHARILRRLVELARAHPGLLVVDESSMVKNWKAHRTRALVQLSEAMAHGLILTGTPVTSSPLDVYAQFEAMDKGSLGFHSYLAFDRQYAIRQRRRLAAGGHYEEVVGFHHLDDLEKRVAKLSYRARAADCLDLPEVVTKSIPVATSREQADILRSLKNEMMAELDGGATIDGRNILTRYLRMSQILGGFVGVLDEEGRPSEEVRAFDPNPKLDAMLEYLELLFDDPEQKAVVFAQYRAEIEAIGEAARQAGWKPVLFYGGVKEAKREEDRLRFKRDPYSRLFVAQYRAGSKGLTLVEAATVAFYSLTFSLEDFLQARKRVHRIGQTKTVTEVFFLSQIEGRRGPRQTLDHLILRALQRKQNFADVITGDARKILEAL